MHADARRSIRTYICTDMHREVHPCTDMHRYAHTFSYVHSMRAMTTATVCLPQRDFILPKLAI